MKLRPDEFYWIVTEGSVLSENAPKDIADKIKQYQNEYYKGNTISADYWRVIDDIYSYIDVINLTYDMPYIDLEKGFAIYKAVIKIAGKYYTFTYKEGPYCDYKEQAREEDIELTEVTPIKETVTKYI